jgi:hypothetical protein
MYINTTAHLLPTTGSATQQLKAPEKAINGPGGVPEDNVSSGEKRDQETGNSANKCECAGNEHSAA